MRFFRRSEKKELEVELKNIYKFKTNHMLKRMMPWKRREDEETKPESYRFSELYSLFRWRLFSFSFVVCSRPLVVQAKHTHIHRWLQLVPFEIFGTSWHFCIRQLTLAMPKHTVANALSLSLSFSSAHSVYVIVSISICNFHNILT